MFFLNATSNSGVFLTRVTRHTLFYISASPLLNVCSNSILIREFVGLKTVCMYAGLESECFGEKPASENLEGKAFLQVYKSVLNSKASEDSLVSSLFR